MIYRHICVLFCALGISACANDNYIASSGDPARMKLALTDCKHQATDAYIKSTSKQNAMNGVFGGIAGGLAAGGSVLIAAALGATAVVTAAAIPRDQEPMKSSDIDPMIERCMATKGYIGTSEN